MLDTVTHITAHSDGTIKGVQRIIIGSTVHRIEAIIPVLLSVCSCIQKPYSVPRILPHNNINQFKIRTLWNCFGDINLS